MNQVQKIRRWGRIQCVCGREWGVHGGELYKDGLDIDEAREWSNGALGITLNNLQFIQRTMGDTKIKMVPRNVLRNVTQAAVKGS